MISIIFAILLGIAVLLLVLSSQKRTAPAGKPVEKTAPVDPFVIKPYIQLGNAPKLGREETLEVVWFTRKEGKEWEVEQDTGSGWQSVPEILVEQVALKGVRPMFRHTAVLAGLRPGFRVRYRLLHKSIQVFASDTVARKSADQPYRFAAFGDFAFGKPASQKIAYQLQRSAPDFVMLAGDIAYKKGRISEYLEKFFPAINADKATPEQGAPVLRSVLFMAAAGNHDMGTPDNWDVRDFNEHPDHLGYFLFWSQPQNGPDLKLNGPNTAVILGDADRQQAFLQAAGSRYPRGTNFSFDYGNSHWLVLDANNYMDWTDAGLRKWVEDDLSAAAGATWKFVCFHQPSFSADAKHWREQRMRLLADILQRHHVDVVFSGHHHAYERSFPLRFTLERQPDGSMIAEDGRVSGRFTFDKEYDGRTITKPTGIIYIVSGGSGATLNRSDDHAYPITLPPFTDKIINTVHSFTSCQVLGNTLTVRQISEDGKELDSWVVTK